MTSAHHGPDEDVIMAYLDGELDAAAADQVKAHLEACAACAGLAEGLRGTSAALATWDTGPVPAFASKVRDIRSGAWWGRVPKHYAALAAAAVLVVAAAVWSRPLHSPAAKDSIMVHVGGAESAPATQVMPEARASASYPQVLGSPAMAPPAAMAERAGTQPPDVSGGPLLARTARMMLTATDFEAARRRFETVVSGAGGFMGQVAVSAANRQQRTLSATVRVPSGQFEKTLAELRTIGTVTTESQDGEDVSRQSVDLDARLVNARASEARLKTILEQRTGRLSDVLDVEREISRVRGEVERMEAERKDLDRRIHYASISVTIYEEQKASLDLGPMPLSTRFRNAFVEGWTTVVSGAIEAGLLLTALLPTVVVLSLFALPVVLLLRRRLKSPPHSVR